jgi:aspartyl-tRNA(Asn)/glutamyl-tRNA(Gln) amidotransferase subunit A
MALATLGTDTGGSVRIPAAACGLVGLKPGLGEVSLEGVVPLSRTLDHAGPLTRSVADAWHVYEALLGRIPVRPPGPVPVSAMRLAVPRKYFCDVLDDDVRARFDAALDSLGRAGARLAEIEIHNAPQIAAVYLPIVLSDAAAYHASALEAMADRYTTPVRLRLEMGRYVLAEDYVRALAGRAALRRQVDAALSEYDALVLPTLPVPAPLLGTESMRVGGTIESVRSLMLRLTQLFNLTGHPAVSVPCGRTRDGLPCGLQLVGPGGRTRALLQIALACEPLIGA